MPVLKCVKSLGSKVSPRMHVRVTLDLMGLDAVDVSYRYIHTSLVISCSGMNDCNRGKSQQGRKAMKPQTSASSCWLVSLHTIASSLDLKYVPSLFYRVT